MTGINAAQSSAQSYDSSYSHDDVDSAVDNIEQRLSQSWTDWDVTKNDLREINDIVGGLSPDEKNSVISELSDDTLETWGKELDGFSGGLSADERQELYKDLAQDINAEQLLRVSDAFGDDHQDGLMRAVQSHASSETRVQYVEGMQQRSMDSIDVPDGLTDEQKALYLDLAQLGLDVVGIVEPTPFADGSNGLISLFRGDWVGAGLSALGVIPYIGDLAKIGKLGRWANTVTNVIEAAGKSDRFSGIVKPVLEKIAKGIGDIPDSVFNKLPKSAQDALSALRTKIDDFLSGSSSGSPGGKPPINGRNNDPVKLGDDLPVRTETRTAPPRDELDPQEIERFSFNHETGQTNIAEGVGTARANAVIEGDVRLPDTNDLGIDFYIDDVPVSLKGPLINGSSGANIPINDTMVDGLAKSVLKDMRLNTATDTIVIDTMNLTAAQRANLKSTIEAGMQNLDNAGKTLIFLD
ncbi:MAG: hypothetical protein KTR35_06395 [Gammaproteobacteria bacterium]|nr:hypothetical protein [Gammaproteobacteria bacterium]